MLQAKFSRKHPRCGHADTDMDWLQALGGTVRNCTRSKFWYNGANISEQSNPCKQHPQDFLSWIRGPWEATGDDLSPGADADVIC